MAQFQNTTDFELVSVNISPADGSAGFEIRPLVQSFTYVENVNYPSVMATLVVVDSGGLLNKLPIQGGEIVKLRIKTSVDENGIDYTMRVWKVGNRYVKNQDQAYTLGLVSEEILNNEYLRVEVPLQGRPDEIVAKLMKEYLKTSKQFYTEACLFSVRLIAARKRVFDIISMLMSKSVPTTQSKPQTSATKNNSKTTAQEQEVAGSAGFFFWENKRGYNFFSVDTLCSEKETKAYNGKPWGPYIEKIANQSDGADDRFAISNIIFTSEIDLAAGLRMGRYATKMCFFNHSTGQYDEYVYNVKTAFDDMKHLGSQTEPSIIKLGNNKSIADYPTRLMSMLLDHETWYNEDKPASPYPKDGATNPSPYAERHLEYAAQSIARYESLSNQTATIVFPGNSQICAGDKIDIRITNKLPTNNLNKEPYDVENSGVYLIMEVTHEYDTTYSTNGRFVTTVRVARDTHGMKDNVSKHGQ
jgi:hypothetical protein